MKTFAIDEYDEDSEQGDLVKALPKSKRDADWVMTDVNARTSIKVRELLILN